MKELKDGSVHLAVTCPPYFSSPFDYPDLFGSYEEFLKTMPNVIAELKSSQSLPTVVTNGLRHCKPGTLAPICSTLGKATAAEGSAKATVLLSVPEVAKALAVLGG
jgi:hypothetical protein